MYLKCDVNMKMINIGKQYQSFKNWIIQIQVHDLNVEAGDIDDLYTQNILEEVKVNEMYLCVFTNLSHDDIVIYNCN